MEGDTYEYTWLAGTPCVIVDTYHNVDGGKLASVYLLNSKKGTAELLFAKQTKAPDDIKIDVATSPSLLHAIFDIREGEREYHMVLPINGGQLRPSPDIDEATTAGLRGPLWSSDGTAIYQKGGQIEVMLEASSILKLEVAKSGATEVQAELDKAALQLMLAARPPAPPAGTPVYEVVPANGVLRPVRFRAGWQPAPEMSLGVEPKARSLALKFNSGEGTADSLWLVRSEEDPSPVLVSPHAQWAQMAPRGIAIAYLVDSALFVRPIA
jgi:hypothetical protein